MTSGTSPCTIRQARPGDFEKRFKALLKQLEQDTNSILFIDEIHTIIGAGAASGGLINEQDAVGILLQLFQQRFKAFFKIATVFRPGQQLAARSMRLT
jgi:ATP-dependent Clp protease ATP-binding subunit ClpA